jgi:uncharacterized membrane protein YdjX (TVP38/TMEM64 family)
MKRSTLVPLLILLGLTSLGVSFFFLPIRELLEDFLKWVEGLGFWGLVILGLIYIPGAVLLVPGSLITLGGGALFGLVPATIAISLGSTAGAAAAFLVGRTLARRWVEEKIAGNPKFQAIDRAIAQQGFKIVLLLRLSPVFPYTLLNYALSLTRISFRDYLLASWIGMLPGTVMYVYLGSVLGNLASVFAERKEKDTTQQIIFYLGLVVTIVATVVITRIARNALNQAIGSAENRSQESGVRSQESGVRKNTDP